MIRLGTNEDIPRLVELSEVSHAEYSFSDMQFNKEKCANHYANVINNHGFCVVYESNGVVVGGMVGGFYQPFYSDDFIGYEDGIFFEKEHRNGKAVYKMVQLFIEYCKHYKVKQIRVGISTGMQGIKRLYEKFGFEEMGNNYLMRV